MVLIFLTALPSNFVPLSKKENVKISAKSIENYTQIYYIHQATLVLNLAKID